MLTTPGFVQEVTGYDVTLETIAKAQHVILAYLGRLESDVTDPTDRSILAKAVSYQAAYMHEDPNKVFEQVALSQIAQFGQAMTFRTDGLTPWLAPLAIIACNRLSWKRMRSVKTGPIFYSPPAVHGWEVE